MSILSIYPVSDSRVDVSLNDPERGNCLSAAMVDGLSAVIAQASNDGHRLLVLRGVGRNFCTGFDLSNLNTISDGDLLLRFVRIEELLTLIWDAPLRIIAIAQGHAIGAGADVFTACQRRIALKGSRFAFPGSGFGLVLGTRRLAVRVGATNAHDLAATGRCIEVEKACSLGLATDIAEDEAGVEALLCQEDDRLQRIDLSTEIGLSRAARLHSETLDSDLAALVRSAARPGLRDRITAYRKATLQK